ncbi:MAG: hypothetical protein ACP5M4_09080 [Acidobacteriaceae bacterium]
MAIMAFVSGHIPLLFGALSSLITIISMSAVTVTGFQYLRAMEASQARVRADQQDGRHDAPRR